MADAVLPETIFAPTIAMIGCRTTVAALKLFSKGAKKLSTCSKQARCRRRQVRRLSGWAAGKARRDCRHDPTVHQHANREHESPHIQKQKQRLLWRHITTLHLDPCELFLQLPGTAGIKKPLKFRGKAAAGFC